MKMVSSHLLLQPILADEYVRTDVSTVKVLSAQLTDKKLASKLLVDLTKRFPLNSLNHLKRIALKNDTLKVIICPAEELTERKELVDQICRQFDLIDRQLVDVPATQPMTRAQFQEASQLWTTNFHENKYIAKCLNGQLFDDEMRQKIYQNMNNLLELKSSVKNSMAVSITDGVKQIASAISDDSQQHPIKHAVILAIESVAAQHRSDDKSDNSKTKPYLCTGYDVFTTQQPCLICCMALVHSRIKRIFFLESEDFDKRCCDKSLTLFKLHTIKNLNHHYEAWKVTFQL